MTDIVETPRVVKVYRERLDIPPWEPSFWERGLVRYGALSYSLWARTIWKTWRNHRRRLAKARKEAGR